jgi:hypothetical protein
MVVVFVCVCAPSQPPTVLNLNTTQLTFTEGDPPKRIINDFSIADVDDTFMASARVTFAATNYEPNEDILNCTLIHDGISCVFNPQTGVLQMTGNASIASYQVIK